MQGSYTERGRHRVSAGCTGQTSIARRLKHMPLCAQQRRRRPTARRKRGFTSPRACLRPKAHRVRDGDLLSSRSLHGESSGRPTDSTWQVARPIPGRRGIGRGHTGADLRYMQRAGCARSGSTAVPPAQAGAVPSGERNGPGSQPSARTRKRAAVATRATQRNDGEPCARVAGSYE